MATKLQEPPLVDVRVSNPVTYLRLWWDKVMGKEGVDFRFTIHPITAFLIAFGVATAFFGIGRYSVNIPFLKYQIIATIKPTSVPIESWKETAFTGTLHFSSATKKYFLQVTSSSEAITLQVPANVDLSNLVGKRILTFGNYNKNDRLLIVVDTKNLEVLPKTPVPLPTLESTPSPLSTTIAAPKTDPTPIIPPPIE